MSLGARVAGILAAAALAQAWAAALALAESGAEAFARNDFAAAAELWRQEAAAGSAQAKFGLGLISDLGLGVPRDAAKAMRWYLEAAEDGYGNAQFNVAVMLDAGTGVPRSLPAAAVWYARAAANGHHRAQYNLGLLYAGGEGLPQNADLARYWLGRAGEALPAAREHLGVLAPAKEGQRVFAAPVVLAGALVGAGEARKAELVWSAPPGPPAAQFLLEIVRLPGPGERTGTVVQALATRASAHMVPLSAPGLYAWRVSLVDPAAARYAARPWQHLSGTAGTAAPALPEGRVTLLVQAEDALAAYLARELAESFAEAGLWVRIEPARDRASVTSVRYAFRDDADLAARVAEFLPVLGAEDALLSPEIAAAPGEIVVRLVGGPREPAP
ncbi:MAG TPA: tetratricopeptide repeat protein [Paracoccaceae bacterium]|nr:tetratricopeptide repeat protein [Paracoccaceae bacterium]